MANHCASEQHSDSEVVGLPVQNHRLQLNHKAKCHILKIGHEKTRVVLIDDAFSELAPVQDMAAALTYEQESATWYPGVRARCPDVLREALLQMTTGVIKQAYHLADHEKLADQGSWISIASTPAKELHPLQCVPHFDSQHKTDFAIMLYAGRRSFQGTGFYRHNPTGFENITPDRWPDFEAARTSYTPETGHRKQDYFHHSNDEYTLMGKIDYRPNRLLIYPGTLLHSGLVDAGADLDTSPLSGRLTVNIFAGVN